MTPKLNTLRLAKLDSTGKPMISLRDEKGSALSEFIVETGLTNPRLDKDFVYLNGQLLIERTVAPSEPGMTTHSTLKTGNSYNFQLTSQTGQASYAVDISAPSGWRRQVSGLHPDSQNVFSISEGEFSPNETNFVRVKIESPQPSGYSAPVSLSFDPAVGGASTNQIRTLSISRSGTNIILRWALNQANGKQTKLYFKRADNGTTYLLTPQALNSSLTSFTLDSQALASPCGNFWGTQFQIGIETGPGPSGDLGSSRPGEQGTQDGCGGPPPPSPAPAMKFVNSYRHLDHLGSLRIARGDIGAPEGGVSSALDLYPFGSPFASAVANSRRQFTGHERDAGAGMDYMLARTSSIGLSRFVSVDPLDGVGIDPQTWNHYSYTVNNPMNYIDRTGLAEGTNFYLFTLGGAIRNETSGSVVWIATDVDTDGDGGTENYVIPLDPGESSEEFTVDADAYIEGGGASDSDTGLDPGEATKITDLDSLTIRDAADKGQRYHQPVAGWEIRAGLPLKTDKTAGRLLGAKDARKLGWTKPSDERTARANKERLRKLMTAKTKGGKPKVTKRPKSPKPNGKRGNEGKRNPSSPGPACGTTGDVECTSPSSGW